MTSNSSLNCKKPNKVLILGSGALKIGQAGEFDYSGSQALKALKEENISTVLINPNIATIQTDKGLADKVYFLPVNTYFVEKIIKKEKVDALLLSFGGQTALNCGLELEEQGILEKYNVEILGTPVSTIRTTEDRHLFAQTLTKIGVKSARSKAVYSTEEALEAAREIGFPVMMRSGFSLGGQGSSIVYDEKECRDVAEVSFASVSQILVEECLKGWKEIEYEVVRDATDNCVTVCNMENFDPMGIHTGESIVVAPSQTLNDFEYQMLRDVAIKTIRHLGIVGECNIQYALDPNSTEYRVIEVNARLSRSSALASKATGYPLAYVAAKIALGYDLTQIKNSITKVTTAFFEPSLDYVVCKFPRWDLDKFDEVDKLIGSEMKSVGEVMAIGRSFSEVIQKAIRMLEIGFYGLNPDSHDFDDLDSELSNPTSKRIFAVAKAFAQGYSVDKIFDLTKIDRFFLYEIERIVSLSAKIKGLELKSIDKVFMLELKQAGFSDKTISHLLQLTEEEVRQHRHSLDVRPHLSQIDTLAAEYPAETNFLYFTYYASKDDACFGASDKSKKVMVLGSGCYRIGASVEFDWCAVSAVKAAEELGYETILLNYNPETVSTDYDNCDKLVFDEISLETVIELYNIENPQGLLIAMGGQTPNNLATKLSRYGIPVFGTLPESIDKAEDRNKFSSILDSINVKQPRWAEFTADDDLEDVVRSIGGFPVLVRPSYVLSGAAMRVAYTIDELEKFLSKAVEISSEHPVTISKFEHHSREIEFDAVAYKGEVKLFAISEHIEQAGVHSGDATLVIPPQRLTMETMKKVKLVGERIAKEYNITGPFNIQMLGRQHNVKVIELNLRASRSFPYVSKALGINFISEATAYMLEGRPLTQNKPKNLLEVNYVTVKAPQFSYNRIKGADPRLGVEMSSTGEVACFGRDTEEALLSAMIATGFRIPKKGILISLETEDDRFDFTHEAELLSKKGIKIYATPKTRTILDQYGIDAQEVNVRSLIQGGVDPLVQFLKSGKVDMVVSVPGAARVSTTKRGYWLRRLAVDLGMTFITDMWLAKRVIHAICTYKVKDIDILSWDEYIKNESISPLLEPLNVDNVSAA